MSRELLKRAAVVLREVWDNDDCYCAPSVIELQKEIVAYLAQPEPEPVLLSDNDISSICQHWVSIGVKEATMARFIRSLEAAVLRANGSDWLRLK